MTYHPAKVLNVISSDNTVKSSDNSVQAVLEMWDDNIFTFLVADKIASDVKKEQVVLVDYRPIPDVKMPVPSQKVVKILGKDGKDIWNKYKEFHKSRKNMPMLPTQQPSYMG